MKKSRSRSADLSKFGKLAEYNRRRRFDVTPEPAGKMGRAKKKNWNLSFRNTVQAVSTTIFA